MGLWRPVRVCGELLLPGGAGAGALPQPRPVPRPAHGFRGPRCRFPARQRRLPPHPAGLQPAGARPGARLPVEVPYRVPGHLPVLPERQAHALYCRLPTAA
uniref:Putative secreted protein n=1 Tax=Ixodes ricinus TaxID=34613 RepID=A0A6B0UG39_IXORI